MKSIYETFTDDEFKKLSRLKKECKTSWYKLVASLYHRPIREVVIKFFKNKKKVGRKLKPSKINFIIGLEK